jgi:hypothetical protein
MELVIKGEIMELVIKNTELVFCDVEGKEPMSHGQASIGVLVGKEDEQLLKENGAKIHTHPSGESWVKLWVSAGEMVLAYNGDTADVTLYGFKWSVGTRSGMKLYVKNITVHS